MLNQYLMEISSIDQEVTDFDWYAVDLTGYLVQFSSGGGSLPNSVAASSEALAQLTHYFLTLSTETTAAHLNPDLSVLVPHAQNEAAAALYAYRSVNYAKSGLFAFDKTDLTHQDNRYHLVASPAKPLPFAKLPPAIGALVSRTRLPWAISGIATLDANAIE
jgi:hypothetical protein